MAGARSLAAIAAVALAATVAALAFTWQRGLGSLYDDSVSYLIMAQAMNPWSTPSAGVAGAAPLQTYPPLLPWLLALTGGATDWRLAHALVALCFGASVALLGLLARDVSGSGVTGALVAAGLACLPEAWLNLKGVLSEFPYLALSLAALLWHRRLDAQRRAHWIVLGLLLAAALLTRTIGVALVAGIAAAEGLRWARQRDRDRTSGALVALAIAGIAAAAWYALRPARGSDVYGSVASDLLGRTLAAGPGWILEMASDNLASLMHAWMHALMIFWVSPWQPGALLAIVLGIAAIAATLLRAWRGEADALYVLAFAAILLLWPFPGHMYRLALPMVPVLLLAVAWAAHEAARRGAESAKGHRYAALAAALPLALCVPASLFYVVARASEPGEPVGDYRRTDIAEFYRVTAGPLAASIAASQLRVLADMERMRTGLPAGARVMGYVPEYLALLTQHESVRLPETRDAARLAAEVARTRAGYIYVSAVRLREDGTGGSEPLAPVRLAAAYARPVWARPAPNGALESVLLQVDPARLPGAQ